MGTIITMTTFYILLGLYLSWGIFSTYKLCKADNPFNQFDDKQEVWIALSFWTVLWPVTHFLLALWALEEDAKKRL